MLQPPNIDARKLFRDVSPYAKPQLGRSIWEILITAVPFVLLWALMWAALSRGYLLGMLLAIPAGGFLLRLFLIQHDCGHGALFHGRRTNDWVGRAVSVLTLTPYDFWRRSHALHHATAGNLGKRGTGDVDTLTVSEYLGKSPKQRFLYRSIEARSSCWGSGPPTCSCCATASRSDSCGGAGALGRAPWERMPPSPPSLGS
jgi:omega-6 fatty acid desaturase (delta-12 desaturase)